MKLVNPNAKIIGLRYKFFQPMIRLNIECSLVHFLALLKYMPNSSPKEIVPIYGELGRFVIPDRSTIKPGEGTQSTFGLHDSPNIYWLNFIQNAEEIQASLGKLDGDSGKKDNIEKGMITGSQSTIFDLELSKRKWKKLVEKIDLDYQSEWNKPEIFKQITMIFQEL